MPASHVLYTNRMRKNVRIAMKLGQILQVHPYRWNDRLQKPEKVTGIRYTLWILNVTLALTHSILMIFRCCHTISMNDLPIHKKMHYVMVTAFYGFIPVVQTTLILNRHVFHVFVRKCMVYFCSFEEKYIVFNAKTPMIIKECTLFEILTALSFWSEGVMLIIPALLYPDSPESVVWLVQYFVDRPSNLHQQRPSWLTYGISAGYQAIILSNLTQWSVLLVICWFNCIFPALVILKELSKKKEISRGNLDTDRFEVYEHLTAIVNETNAMFNGTVAGGELAFIVVTILGIYCGIRVGGVVGATAGFIGFVAGLFLMIFLAFFADFVKLSDELLMEWKRDAVVQGKYFRTKLRAMQRLKMRIGGYFFIDKLIVLTVCKILFDSIVNVLLIG